jgi:hypothetical protein
MKRATLLLMIVATIVLAAVTPGYAHTASVSAIRPLTFRLQTYAFETTTRQQIVDEFKRRLATIDSSAAPLASGYQYQTDIGKNGIDEWATNYNEDQLRNAQGAARISVFDLVRTRSEKQTYDAGSVDATLPVQTRSYHLRDLTPAEVRKHLADMAQAVITDPDTGQRDLTLGGLAIDIEMSDDGFVIPHEVFTIEAAAIGWNVKQVIDPYDQ